MGKVGLGKGSGKFELTDVSAIHDLDSGATMEIYDSQSQMLNGNFKVWKLDDILRIGFTWRPSV